MYNFQLSLQFISHIISLQVMLVVSVHDIISSHVYGFHCMLQFIVHVAVCRSCLQLTYIFTLYNFQFMFIPCKSTFTVMSFQLSLKLPDHRIRITACATIITIHVSKAHESGFIFYEENSRLLYVKLCLTFQNLLARSFVRLTSHLQFCPVGIHGCSGQVLEKMDTICSHYEHYIRVHVFNQQSLGRRAA